MPACDGCSVAPGDLDEGGIWVGGEGGFIGRKKWIKHRWTVEIGGRSYAVGQDQDHNVIAYAAEAGGSSFSLWGATSATIRYALLTIVLAVWSVVGFVFWIPLIVRATAAFCVTAVYANLARANADVPNEGLQHAALFYVSGYRSIYRAIIEPHSTELERTPAFRGGRFLGETIWTALFWWAVLFVLAGSGEALGFSRAELVDPALWLVDRLAAAGGWLVDTIEGLIRQATGSVQVQPEASAGAETVTRT